MKARILTNEQVEDEVVGALGTTARRCSQIQKATGIELRALDRALQRLRRAGRIKLVTGPGGGWVRL